MTGRSNQTVELFSGPKIFPSIAQVLGYDTLTVDRNASTNPDIAADVRELSSSKLPVKPLIIWAALPDQTFNFPGGEGHWDEYGFPISEAAKEARSSYEGMQRIFRETDVQWWFIENPYGPLRHFPAMAGFNRGYPTRNRITIDHSDYGPFASFRTDVWTNAFWWNPRKEAVSRLARRPADEAPQEVGPDGRRLPASAIAEMFDQLDSYIRIAGTEAARPKLNS